MKIYDTVIKWNDAKEPPKLPFATEYLVIRETSIVDIETLEPSFTEYEIDICTYDPKPYESDLKGGTWRNLSNDPICDVAAWAEYAEPKVKAV